MGRARAGLEATLCRDPRAFALLRSEWDALQRRCSSATPFQSHAWLESWWLSYGGRGRLRVVLVRLDGRLIAAAPLMLVHRPLPLLVLLGGPISDYGDVLVDDGHQGCAVAALERGLRRAARHAVVDLREVRPGAAAERLYESWRGGKRRLPDSVCLELPAAPMDELVQRLAAKPAQRVRAKLRRIDALRIEGRAVPEAEVPDAIGHLLRLHELQWRGRGVTVEHLRPRFAEHLLRATRRMVRDGDAALTEYRRDGEVVAASVALHSSALTGGYLYGAHPGLREEKVDVTAMLLRQEAELAARTGRRVVSMLRGREPYKSHWRPEAVGNQRLLMAPAALEPVLRLHTARAAWRDRAAGAVAARLPAAQEWRARVNDLRASLHRPGP
ncbi:GNAT family N-acetyltransferase [Streptomyces yaizuensis]|uniref:GNAT family N-acetyltransferase n=1 Tax=Streptomyces yaizuensis TaxID=2989713 RepID=A0ABQ5NVG3_9ACTN|nr:GNAT family N-acetyltransferase [Streptomyces sp. YSPA8]GLF94351.1 GNAT family N-acetyltransferase [Streptomyces sp. YSPA8]